MAHLVQRLIARAFLLAASILPVAAQQGSFSHELHLKLKPDCLACHPKAATSTRLDDNLLPAAEACAGCHKEVSIKQPRELRLKSFNHSFHLKMGNVAPLLMAAIKSKTFLGDVPPDELRHLEQAKTACAGCHRGMHESKQVSREAFPHMGDCLVCHNKIDPPFSCETCHLGDKALRPVAHTPDYLDTHTKKSVKEGCANCHGRRFTCLGCH